MPTDILRQIGQISSPRKRSDGSAYKSLSDDNTRLLSQNFGLSRREIAIIALRGGVIPERYIRNMKSLTAADQIKLLKSCVVVIGLGGLGGLVSETLARLGVGKLRLVDGDVFEESNLNRQLFSAQDLISQPKSNAAAQRITRINPDIEVKAHFEFLTKDNAERLIQRADIVVDCLDSITARFTLEASAKKCAIPMVSAAVAGTSGQVTAIFPPDPGLRLIYGPPDQAPASGSEAALGCISYAVNLIASLECAEVANILLKHSSRLRNRLLIADLEDFTFETVQLCNETEK